MNYIFYKGFPIEIWEDRNGKLKYSCLSIVSESHVEVIEELEEKYLKEGISFEQAKEENGRSIALFYFFFFLVALIYLIIKLYLNGEHYLL